MLPCQESSARIKEREMLSLSRTSELATVIEGRVCLMYLQQIFRETLLLLVILLAGFTPLSIMLLNFISLWFIIPVFFFLIKQACA